MPGLLKVDLQPSTYIKAYLLALTGLAMLSAYLYLPSFIIFIVFASSIAAYSCLCWRSYCWDSRIYTVLRGQNTWQLVYADRTVDVDLQAATLWPWLLAIKFQNPVDKKKQCLLILPDSCHADDFWRLRVLLKSHKSYGHG